MVLGGFRSFHILVTTIIIFIFYRNMSSLKRSYLSGGGGGVACVADALNLLYIASAN